MITGGERLVFIVGIVSHVAWPAATLGAIALLREPLTSLMNGRPLQTLKLGRGMFEAEWADDWAAEATNAREDAFADGPPGKESPGQQGLAEASRLAGLAPAAAVLTAHGEVQRALVELYDKKGTGEASKLPIGKAVNVTRLTNIALQEGLIDAELASALDGLRTLRNLASHVPNSDELDPPRAREYVSIAAAVVASLRRAAT